MKPVLEFENVRRSFGSRDVLCGATASAPAGKVVGLLGRNGEGKTTLFKILLDMLEADGGSVNVLGSAPDGSGGIRQKVGYIPERPVFHSFMTIAEVYALRSRFFRKWNSQKAMDLSKRLELSLDTPISGASKGTLGKIAWVCAAAHDPELYLLDEPTSGLDALVRDDILGHLIEELHDSGKTILAANHRMEEMAGVLDEVWVLSGGRITSIHDVDLLRREACRVTGRLINGKSLPAGIAAVEIPTEGPLVQWAVFTRKDAEKLLAMGLLTDADKSPLPLEASLKYLLKGGQDA